MKFNLVNTIIPAVILSSIFLSACNSNTHIDQGKEYLNSGNYDQAIQQLSQAVNDDPSNIEAGQLLSEARESKGDDLFETAESHLEENDLENALSTLKELHEFEEDHVEDINILINDIEDRIQLSEDLNRYDEWFIETEDQLYELLSSWRAESDSFSLGHISDEEFAESIEDLHSKSSEIVSSSEQEISNYRGPIRDLHLEFVSDARNIHETIRNLILELRNNGEDSSTSDILNIGSSLSNINELLIDYDESLDSIADTHEVERR